MVRDIDGLPEERRGDYRMRELWCPCHCIKGVGFQRDMWGGTTVDIRVPAQATSHAVGDISPPRAAVRPPAGWGVAIIEILARVNLRHSGVQSRDRLLVQLFFTPQRFDLNLI